MKEIKYNSTESGICSTPCPHGQKSIMGDIIYVGSLICHACIYNDGYNTITQIVKCDQSKTKRKNVNAKEILQSHINVDVGFAIEHGRSLHISSVISAMEEYGLAVYNQAIDDVLDLREDYGYETCEDLIADVNNLKKE